MNTYLLDNKTGILSFANKERSHQFKLFTPDYGFLNNVLGDRREKSELVYDKNGVSVLSTLFCHHIDEATFVSTPQLINGKPVLLVESVSLSAQSYARFAAVLLKNKGGVSLETIADWLDLGSREGLALSKTLVVSIQDETKKQLNFVFDAEQQQFQLLSAAWTTDTANVNYGTLLGATLLTVQAKGKAQKLVLTQDDLTLEHKDPNAILLVALSNTTTEFILPNNAKDFRQVTINGGSSELRILLGELSRAESVFAWDGQDLLISTGPQHTIRVTNALGIKALSIGFADGEKVSINDALATIWLEQNTAQQAVQQLFTLEKAHSVIRIGENVYFTGQSGVQYRMQGESITAIGYTGKGQLTLPEGGIRSLALLKNIVDGNTVFGMQQIHGVDMNQLFPQTGQAAIDLLATMESESWDNTLQQIIRLAEKNVGPQVLHALDGADGLAVAMVRQMESLLIKQENHASAPLAERSSSWAEGSLSSLHMEKLIMAMSSMVEGGGQMEWQAGHLRAVDAGRPTLTLIH